MISRMPVDELPSFIEKNHTTYKNMAYIALKTRKSLDEQTQDIYFFTYIVDSPTPGALFNLAWNYDEKFFLWLVFS